MSSHDKYFLKYQKSKQECKRLTLEIKRMQTLMESCRVLLHSGLECGETLPSPMEAAQKSQASRRLFYPSSDSSDSEEVHTCKSMEPGENKWECLSEEERRKLSAEWDEQIDSKFRTSSPLPLVDTDMTQFDNADKNTAVAEDNSPKRLNVTIPTSSENTVPMQRSQKKRKALSPIGHVCPLPRCPLHQPFYVSSKRELAKLSPCSRRMATSTHVKTPPGYFGLDFPSTQYIRTRNQSSEL